MAKKTAMTGKIMQVAGIGAGAGASVGAEAGEKNTRAGQKWTGSATLNYIQHRMVHNTNVR